MAQKPINLHKVINDFDKAYGQPHLSIKVSNIDNSCIYLRITYEKNVPVTEDNLVKGDYVVAGPGDTTNIYVMCRIWINEEEDKFGKKTHTYIPVLWKDAIYINDYTMPLKDRQQNFFAAMRKWCDGYGDFLLGSYQPIELGQSILHQAKKEALYSLKKTSEMADCLFNKHRTHYLLSGETVDEQIPNLLYRIKRIKPVTDCILYSMNNRGAIPQPAD